jgi:hypothetical protein
MIIKIIKQTPIIKKEILAGWLPCFNFHPHGGSILDKMSKMLPL